MKRMLQLIVEVILAIATFCVAITIVSKYDEVHHIDFVVYGVSGDEQEDVKLYEDYITASTSVVNMQKKDEFLVIVPIGYEDTNVSVYLDNEWRNVDFKSIGNNQYLVKFTEEEGAKITYRIKAFNSDEEVIMCYFSYRFKR